MKRQTKILLILIGMTVFLSACSSTSLRYVDGYPWAIGEESRYVEPDTDVITFLADNKTLLETKTVFQISNAGTKTLYYGSGYSLEIELDDKWYEIPCDFDISTEEFEIAPGETDLFMVYWTDSYGTLPDGHYRIIKEIWSNVLLKKRISCDFVITH